MNKHHQQILLAAITSGVPDGAALAAQNISTPSSQTVTEGSYDRAKCNGSCSGKCKAIVAPRR